ncbi:MAG: electron transport complex subunit RsxC [Bacteroidales bacterium]|nr:electron transport complex subunit RsxC [Bacteroidales bacterium]MBN2761523.1 electron transport complex subunit RsxC [Bacteroidales bacterium]
MLYTFSKGGIHPPEHKISSDSRIRDLQIPASVVIPLSQHLGAPARPVVNKGDVVKTGQLIAKGDGFVSSNVHASVSGKIVKIDKAVDLSGYQRPAVFIETADDEWDETIDRNPALATVISLESHDIISRIGEMGVVGLGGATFPSHVKLSVPRGKKAEVLIINGVECEPYLTSDHALMIEKGEEIMMGIQILRKALGVEKVIVGIENNKPDAIRNLSVIAKKYQAVKVAGLKVKYPQGGEKQLIKALINREVPSGGLPVDVGAVAFNVGTAFAVYEAIQKNKPLFERIVTVTGKSLKKPSNFRVRIGTPVSALIEAAGGLPEDTGKIIAGGPMMGKALASTDVPVVKGCSGILLLPENESKRNRIEPCIRCSKCVSVCPMGLEPYLLMSLSQKDMFDRLEEEKVMDCIECGSCSYTCPAKRPLLDYIRLGKARVGKIIRSRKKPA